MTVTPIEGIAAVLMYLFCGALVPFIYEAYVKTRQKNPIYMAIGFFIPIFGGNLTTLVEAVQAQTWWPTAFEASDARALSLVIQLLGIMLLLLSATRPFGRKE
jgi:hypothetical protein